MVVDNVKMVKSCTAFNCTNRFEKCNKSVVFHKFPLKDSKLCKQWVIATKRDCFIPNEYSYICGDHFTTADYLHSDSKRLKQSAVPSIFDFPPHLHKNIDTLKRKAPLHRESPPAKYQALKEFAASNFANKGGVKNTIAEEE